MLSDVGPPSRHIMSISEKFNKRYLCGMHVRLKPGTEVGAKFREFEWPSLTLPKGEGKATCPKITARKIIRFNDGQHHHAYMVSQESFESRTQEHYPLTKGNSRRKREARYKSQMAYYTNKKVPAQPDLGQESLCIKGMRQAEWRIKGSWVPSGKAHTGDTEVISRMGLY
ncbi:hypothetical protein Tco_0001743 [Tanacetum coccineum]